MREVTPYKTRRGLQNALDNGGRFYNIFTDAGDEVVSRAELVKAAGVISNEVKAFLFLEMAQQELVQLDRTFIESLLEADLRRRYRRQKPVTLKPSEVEAQGQAGKAVLVSGYPRFVEDRTEFSMFIMVPVQAGNTTSFIMVPLFDQYDVYEVFDDRRLRKPNSMIATVRGKKLSHDQPIRFGGILKKLEFKDKTKKSHQYYLETAYFTRLNQTKP